MAMCRRQKVAKGVSSKTALSINQRMDQAQRKWFTHLVFWWISNHSMYGHVAVYVFFLTIYFSLDGRLTQICCILSASHAGRVHERRYCRRSCSVIIPSLSYRVVLYKWLLNLSCICRHFDCSLEVEEDDSILAFVTRVRNGEKTARIQRQSTEKKVKSDYSSSANHNTSSSTHGRHKPAQQTAALKRPRYCGDDNNTYHDEYEQDNETTALQKKPKANNSRNDKNNTKSSSGKESGEDNELYCVCNLPSYGNMIACDGKKCPNPSQWYHLECVGISDGQQPDTWYIYICIDID